jgi:hypothetical protein
LAEILDTVDAELGRLIERRSSSEPDPDELEPGYMESVRRYHARIQEENKAAWCTFHQGQAERHRRALQELITYHETQLQKLLEGDT